MACLANEELDALKIEQSVFHIVGPGNEHFQLLEAFNAQPHEAFFLGRIRSVNGGNRYRFLEDAAVRTQLKRIDSNAKAFQEESEKLATAFNEAHGGATAVGAFLLFSLACPNGRVFAMLKFEDEKVLSYGLKKGRSGRPAPTFGEIERTFVQNRNALQKAALIRLGRRGEEAAAFLVDRQNPQRPAAYFERFLGVSRVRTETQLTQAIIEATRKVVTKHRKILPPDTIKGLSRRLYDASQSGGAVDGDRLADWLSSIVGPLSSDSPILKDFRTELAREGMATESFTLDKDAVPEPRNRRVETAKGIKIFFPATLQKSTISVDEDKGLIVIQDKILLNDVELTTNNRPGS